jgi:chromosomal replication initiator protein
VEGQLELTAESLWAEVAGRLKGALNTTTYKTWFAEAGGAELTDEAFVLSVPNDFTREWIEGHFLGLISAAVRDATGQERRIALTVAYSEPELPTTVAAAQATSTEPPPRKGEATGMNSKYTFDSFVIGSSNRFAHAAALAVAEAPAQAYNPLFIYGSTGLGKTHLLQAIAQYTSEHAGGLTARYVTSETFMNDFINSLRDKRIEGFKQRYRTYDVLLIDDVQFFEHKERIQEEFFHTFNTLYEAGSQIVISSDRPPREISTLEERLRSRFEWGLITDIQPPDLETRIAILRKKVKTDGIAVPDAEVLTFIASRISTNIRELEGALTRVVAFSSLTGRPMTTELAQDVLKDVFPQGEFAEVSIKRIQELVIDRFGMSLEELCGDKRSQNIVYPRQVAMYLSRELTDSSLPKIGKEFGGRDHTTVIHATSKIARLIKEDRSVYNLVQELTARIKQVR